MTAATGLKRLGIPVAAIVLACFAALAAVSFFMPFDTVRDAAKAEIRNVTGLDVVLKGDVDVSLFPTGSITFANVTLGEDSNPVLVADQLIARLRFIPLITGRIEISDIALIKPRIRVNYDRDGRSNWAATVETLARALGPKANRPVNVASFSEIRIDDGVIDVNDAARGIKETLSDVDLALAWPSISKSFAATGRFVWHSEPVDAAVTLTDFAAALAGDRSGFKVRLSGPPIKLAFDGNVSTSPTLKVDGTTAADSASLRDTLRWAGYQPNVGGGFGRFAIKAKTSVASGTIALSTVNIELDGNVAEGVLTFSTDGRRSMQGTLAADDLNLTPYLGTIRLLTANERDWNGGPLSFDDLSGFDLDLRLSAARIAIQRAKLGRTAVALNLRGGKLNVTIGESQAFGGVLKGTLSASAADGGADFKSQMQFVDVDLENCLNDLFQFRRLDGRGDMELNLDASGNSVLALTRSMNGSAKLVGRQGAMIGLNVEQLLRRLERRPLSGTGDFRNGRTPFEKLNVDIKIAQGVATVENVSMEGSKVRLGLGGQASIPARDFDLRGVAALASSGAADAQPAFELPFVVQGQWEDPIILPDTQSLMQRSPLASPLLNALKSRGNSKDTVRDALERLIPGALGGAPTGATPPAER
ncbi:AsmA family protein [Rhodoplanes sp. Z2-YC6860]|uniref:AsmA family protein n=1 Tax=Rhodoplanes sp. Z2-YC6860 TaxID=674703 RepID=UPI00078BB62A|nr:AsmA family protein [Rhodoplanes sp. Z2-YC6860]AMN44563.1 AsmA family protein [Rhodoplanes sp. Z2-YC6860]